MLDTDRLCSVRSLKPLPEYLPRALRAVEGRIASLESDNEIVVGAHCDFAGALPL